MNQIPDDASERVLATIREVIELDGEGKVEQARQWMQALVGEFPGASLVHSYLAWVLSREGEHRAAIEHGRVATKLSPESEISSIMLFRVLWSAGEHQQAFEEMKRLEQYGPSEEYERMMREWHEGKLGSGAEEPD